MAQSSTPTPPKKPTADEIRTMWLKKPPEGLFKSDIQAMTDDDILDCWHIANESLDDIFQNATEIRTFGIYSDDDFS